MIKHKFSVGDRVRITYKRSTEAGDFDGQVAKIDQALAERDNRVRAEMAEADRVGGDLVHQLHEHERQPREMVCADERAHSPHAWPHVPSYTCPGVEPEMLKERNSDG